MNGVFPVSRDVLAISTLFSSLIYIYIYKAVRFSIYSECNSKCSSERDSRV